MFDNHDRSSTRYSIEGSVHRDVHRGQLDFEENFHVHQHHSNHTCAVYEYLDNGNLAPKTCVTELLDFSGCRRKDYRRALWAASPETDPRRFIEYHWNPGYTTDWEDEYRQALREDVSIGDWALFDCGVRRLYDELLLEHLKGDKPLFDTYQSRGYCQGDCAIVMIPKSLIEEYTKGVEAIHPIIDHLIWDQPVEAWAKVTDNETGETVFENGLTEYLDDEYEWERDEVIKGLKEEYPPLPEEVIRWFEENLPHDCDQ